MSATKKYIGESQLKGEPKKTLGFKIKDGTITTDKLVDGSITSPKLSDDVQTLLKKIEDLYPTVKIEELDTLGGLLTTHKEAVTLSTQTEKSRFVVMGAWSSRTHVAGILDIVSDAAGHVLTEVLTTHHTMTDGVLSNSGHSDGILYQYFRSYNIASPTLTSEGLAIDSWTEWQRLDTYTLNTVDTKIRDRIPQMIDGIAATVDDLPSTKDLYYYVTSEGSFYLTNGKSSKGTEIGYPYLDAKLLYITKNTNKIYRWTEADGMILLSDFSALDGRVTTLESSVETILADYVKKGDIIIESIEVKTIQSLK